MHRLLLVEDEPELRELVAECLREKYSIESAATLAEAKQHLAFASFDVVLLYVSLPDGDGLAFGKALLSGPRPIPVVFVTGHPEIRDEVLLIPYGFRECLVKPYRIRDLLDCTAALIAQRSRPAAE